MGLQIPQAITLLAQAARTTSSNSGNLRDTATQIPTAESITLYLDVTSNVVVAGTNPNGNLSVALEQSVDSGSTWLTAARFGIVTQSATTRVMNFRPRGLHIAEAATAPTIDVGSPQAAAQTSTMNVNLNMTRDLRVTWVLATTPASTTNGHTVTFGVYAVITPGGVLD